MDELNKMMIKKAVIIFFSPCKYISYIYYLKTSTAYISGKHSIFNPVFADLAWNSALLDGVKGSKTLVSEKWGQHQAKGPD